MIQLARSHMMWISCAVLAMVLASASGCAVYAPRRVFHTIAMDAGALGGACPGCGAEQPECCLCYPDPVALGLHRTRWHALELNVGHQPLEVVHPVESVAVPEPDYSPQPESPEPEVEPSPAAEQPPAQEASDGWRAEADSVAPAAHQDSAISDDYAAAEQLPVVEFTLGPIETP